jgi:hypothetical protein
MPIYIHTNIQNVEFEMFFFSLFTRIASPVLTVNVPWILHFAMIRPMAKFFANCVMAKILDPKDTDMEVAVCLPF